MAKTEWKFEDISYQTYGKYCSCTMHRGLWYSDDDFSLGCGCGLLKWGSIPAPGPDRRPWRGEIVEFIRRLRGRKTNGKS
jgi:hypothetical protein